MLGLVMSRVQSGELVNIQGADAMTCIKTGAVVHMMGHDLVFAADLFVVAGAIVVRANGPIRRDKNAMPLAQSGDVFGPLTHKLRNDVGCEEFWREDLGVFVVPKCCVTVVA